MSDYIKVDVQDDLSVAMIGDHSKIFMDVSKWFKVLSKPVNPQSYTCVSTASLSFQDPGHVLLFM